MLRKPLAVTVPLIVSILQQVAGQTIEDQQLYFMRLTPVDLPGLLTERPQALLNEFYSHGNDAIYLKERVMKSDTSFGLIEIGPLPDTNPYQDTPIPNAVASANGLPNGNGNGVATSEIYVNGVTDTNQAGTTTSQQTAGEEYVEAESVGTIYNDGINVNSDVYGEYWAFNRLSYKRDTTGRRFAVQFTSRHRVTDEGYNGFPSVWVAGNPTFVRGMGGELLFVEGDDGSVTLDAPSGDLWDVFACAITPNYADPTINAFMVPAIFWQILTIQRAVWTQVKYPGISDANPFCIPVSLSLEAVPQTQQAITSIPVIQDIQEVVDTTITNGQSGDINQPVIVNPNDDEYAYDPTNGFSYDETDYPAANAIYIGDNSDGNGLDAISEASSSLEDDGSDNLITNARVNGYGIVRPEQPENSQGVLYLPDGSEADSAPGSFEANTPIYPIQRYNSYTFDDQRSRTGLPEWGLGGIQRFYSAGDLQSVSNAQVDYAALPGVGVGNGGGVGGAVTTAEEDSYTFV
ncbi:hypothetical protein ABW21_db0205637 [Orbilia brochopaga]|nr:hypothetical protein ABW21_db0205637 [Drechslerella brochopaga]